MPITSINPGGNAVYRNTTKPPPPTSTASSRAATRFARAWMSLVRSRADRVMIAADGRLLVQPRSLVVQPLVQLRRV
jgi:hypothetical protein